MTVALIRDTDYQAIRHLVYEDVFAWARIVCGHEDLSEDTHQPLMYLAAGQIDQLIAILDDPSRQSFVVKQIRQRLRARNVNWQTPEGRQQLIDISRFLNIRVFRGAAKSSAITHSVVSWMALREPNLSIAIITNSDDKASDFLKQIGRTVRSPEFGALFPERVPKNPNLDITESGITLGGRTRPDREPTISAFGYRNKRFNAGYHFDIFVFDDFVSDENSSPNELSKALEYLEKFTGMYNPGKRFPIIRLHVGTSYDEQDDDWFLQCLPACFSLRVPIEVHDGPVEDVMTPGTPTCPEWKDAEAILDLKKATIKEGGNAIGWRCNYLLDASAGGGRLFPRQLIEDRRWSKHPKIPNAIYRPAYDTKTRERIVKDDVPQVFITSPNALFRVIGCDQAISQSESSDEWAVTCVGADNEGVIYQLETRHGHGYESMLDAIVAMNDHWAPRWIGIESGAFQQVTHFYIDRIPKYRKLRSKVQKVGHDNKSKEWRITNAVAEPMRMKALWLNPDDHDMASQMELYKPGKHAKDDRIDSLAIATALLKTPVKQRDLEKMAAMEQRRVEARTDRETGIML